MQTNICVCVCVCVQVAEAKYGITLKRFLSSD